MSFFAHGFRTHRFYSKFWGGNRRFIGTESTAYSGSGGIFAYRAVRYGFFVFPVIAFGLGVWQTYRLQWKLGLIEERNRGLSALPQPLPQDITNPETQQRLAFHQISMDGSFVHENEMFVVPRTYQGKGGAHVITPFSLVDGRRVLINRGWIPIDSLDRKLRPEGLISGVTHVNGLLRTAAGKPGRFVPENDAQKNRWYWIDVQTMAQRTGSLPVLLDATATPATSETLPIGGQTVVELSNPHLNYALTWYSLSAVLTLMCFRIIRGGTSARLSKAASDAITPRF